MMTNANKYIKAQKGTLLVEAIAMLGLIALVTPTLYKKSAERLQEIQDINVASQARTMNKVVESFVKQYYLQLQSISSSDANRTIELVENDHGACPAGSTCYTSYGYSAFAPYGYATGDLKNYGSPRVFVKVEDSSMTTYVVYPIEVDIGKKRAARVAALVGANGGIISKPIAGNHLEAFGTGGAWHLDSSQINQVNLNKVDLTENSLVVTSAEPISESDVESDKFLYRGFEPEIKKNTMTTDLYMGGVQGVASKSIYNVRRLLIRSKCDEGGRNGNLGHICEASHPDLYVGEPDSSLGEVITPKDGAAWIWGNLAALKDQFTLKRDDAHNVYMQLAGTANRGATFDYNNDEVEYSDIVFLASSGTSSQVRLVDDFAVTRRNNSGNYEFLVGGGSSAVSGNGLAEGALIRAAREGDIHSLSLNSPDQLGSSEASNFATYINRKGGYVYINGGDASNGAGDPLAETYINDAGGQLQMGRSGGWMLASGRDDSAQVHLLGGAVSSGVTDERIFTVGSLDNSLDANYMIRGDSAQVSLRGGQIRVFSQDNSSLESSVVGGGLAVAQFDSTLSTTPNLKGATALLSKYTDVLGSLYVGMDGLDTSSSSNVAGEVGYSRGTWRVGVSGNALVDGTLAAKRAWIRDIGMKNLHAGFDRYSDFSQHDSAATLNVYNDRMVVRSRAHVSTEAQRMALSDDEDTLFYAAPYKMEMRDLSGASMRMRDGTVDIQSFGGQFYIDSSATEDSSTPAIHMKGNYLANIYTANSTLSGHVNIQHGAFVASGHSGSYENAITANAGRFAIKTREDSTATSARAQFLAEPNDISVNNTNFVAKGRNDETIFKVMPRPNTDEGVSSEANVLVDGTLHVKGNKYIHVAANAETDSETENENHAMFEVEPNYVQIWAKNNGPDGDYAGNLEGDSTYAAMFRVAPYDVEGNSSAVGDTSRASVYVRKGAIELMESSGSSHAGDSGFGYIKANRFVSNTELPIPQETPGTGVMTYTRGTMYDQYMVNPAYTSVMHDIKLTTRGGARLSDALPDYVLKGVYNMINNCPEGNASGAVCDASGMGSWADPYIGIIPYASCPPGYDNLATIVPISFNVGIAGDLIDDGSRPRVNPRPRQADIFLQAAKSAGNIVYPGLEEVSSFVLNSLYSSESTFPFSSNVSSRVDGWFFGFKAKYNTSDWMSSVSDLKPGSSDAGSYAPWEYAKEGTNYKVVAEPLYFQQNTWLKTSVVPDRSKGWAAYMGFIYNTADWGEGLGISGTNTIRSNYNDGIGNDSSTAGFVGGGYVWNLFPVPTNTIEGHATVYCYFNRAKFTGWGDLVDRTDNLAAVRAGSSIVGMGKDSSYSNRLNDPSLMYTDPW